MTIWGQFVLWALGVIVGAIAGVVAGVLLEERLANLKRRLSRRIRGFHYRISGKEHRVGADDEFHIAHWRTNWIVLEGSPTEPFSKSSITCQLDPLPIVLPPDLQAIRERIIEEQEEIRKQYGTATFYPGPMVAFVDYRRDRTIVAEAPLLFLRFRPTDYYSFMATSLSLDETVRLENGSPILVRDKYLRSADFRHPVPELATSFAVNLSFVTQDDYLVIGKRGLARISCYPGYFGVPVNECVHPVKDKVGEGFLDVFRTAQRGAGEELGISVADSEIRFFSLGVDTTWYFYALVGAIYSEQFTRDDIRARRSVGVKDKWENVELHYVQFTPDEVVRFLAQQRSLMPVGFVSIVQTLIWKFGRRAVEKAFLKYPPSS